jgi:uncharacterized membrane protein HdeD (DUF308 family)
MRMLGIILVLAGVLALAYGGFSYTKERKVLDVGPIEGRVDEKHSVPVPPIAGAVAIVAGIVLMMSDRRRVDVP